MSRGDLPITAAIGMALLTSGCGAKRSDRDQAWSSGNDVAVCRDEAGHRVDDDRCRSHGGHGFGAAWYYLARSGRIPPLGGLVGGGSPTPLAGRSYVAAGSVTRGGFGATAEGAHGGGFGGGE